MTTVAKFDQLTSWAELLFENVTEKINAHFQGQPSWQVAAKTAIATGIITYSYCWINQYIREGDEILQKRLRKKFFSFVRSLPIVKQKIKEKVAEVKKDVDSSLFLLKDGMTYYQELPWDGMTHEQVMNKMNEYLVLDEYTETKLSGQVYQADESLKKLNAQVFEMHGYTNPLHADVFQDIRKIEAEAAKMAAHMFHGGPDSSGVVTTGGSESLLVAVLAARNYAYEKGIRYPELVMPITAHAAFDKACNYFRVKAVHVPVDKNYQLNVAAMRRAITKNTCLLVGSFPEYPFGQTDPIEQIAALGVKYDIPVHVDACLGSFVVATMNEAGFKMPNFDFRVPGVSSISCDTHKYGYAPKGTSILLFNDPEYMKYAFFSQPDWLGGIYATPTTGGSRSGALIATAWATMLYHGRSGYIEKSRKVVATTRSLAEQISKIDGLEIMGEPKVCVVAWTSPHFEILRQYEMLKERDWVVSATQFPTGIHFTVTMQHTGDGWLENFVKDIKETAAMCMRNPEEKATGEAALYGMSQTIPDRSLVKEVGYLFWQRYYQTK